jgi:hypothetical protein
LAVLELFVITKFHCTVSKNLVAPIQFYHGKNAKLSVVVVVVVVAVTFVCFLDRLRQRFSATFCPDGQKKIFAKVSWVKKTGIENKTKSKVQIK